MMGLLQPAIHCCCCIIYECMDYEWQRCLLWKFFQDRCPFMCVWFVERPSKVRTHSHLLFGRAVPKSVFVWSESISGFRTHKYYQVTWKVETNPMGPLPGFETQIFRKTSLTCYLVFEVWGDGWGQLRSVFHKWGQLLMVEVSCVKIQRSRISLGYGSDLVHVWNFSTSAGHNSATRLMSNSG